MARTGQVSIRPLVEALENRTLLAADITLDPATQTLVIEGTADADVVWVEQDHDTIIVTCSDGGAITQESFDEDDVAQINFFGRGGDDRFLNDTHKRSAAYGGLGDDTLV